MHQPNMLVTHLTTAQLDAGLDEIRQSPKDAGELKLIVRRPRVNAREVLEEAQLDLIENGKFDPSLPLAFRIADAFELKIGDVFLRDTQP